jgi:hypothetical protein
MKQILLIITLFIGFGNANAQDASNDATWEETIEFINENLQYTKGMNNDFSTIEEVYLKENKIFVVYSSKIGAKKETTFPLSKISKAREWDDSEYCLIYLTGDYCISDYTEKNGKKNIHGHISKTDSVKLFYENELRTRMVKAFNHIAYLNSEKRKKSKF